MIVRIRSANRQGARPAAHTARPAPGGAARFCNALLCVATLVVIASALACRRADVSVVADRAASHPALRWNSEAARVELAGLPAPVLAALSSAEFDAAEWSAVLAVSVADSPEARAMFGAYAVDGDVVTFTPRFPLRPGLGYRAVFDPAGLPGHPAGNGDKVEAAFSLPAAAATTPTTVTAVFPSGDELPMNLLKFYIHFSAPMRRGDSYRHIHLIDADGRNVPDAILEIGEELWDARAQRLTVLFDPGRIKRGVQPNEDLGAPLKPGQSYTLIIEANWRDAHGQSLTSEFRKHFRVGEADYEQPEPRHWRVSPPLSGTRDLLVINLDEPLDRGLLDHSLPIRDAGGREVFGEVFVDEQETRWTFRPDAPWQPGDYQLHVDADLEDRAGNSVGRPFERAYADPDQAIPAANDVDLSFTIAASNAVDP